MSWTCSGTTQDELLSNLISSEILKSPRVIEAFKSVDRAHYVTSIRDAYLDSPSTIGSNATISAPHMHCFAVENLSPYLIPGANVLDIGCGSGYLEGIFFNLVSPNGIVVGIDHLQSLITLSRNNLLKSSTTATALNSGAIKLVLADGRKGCPSHLLPTGLFSAIHVGACSASLPQALVDQLASPGRMFIPIGSDSDQAVFQIDKDKNGRVTKQKLFGVRYIPLTDADLQDPHHN